LDKYGSYLVPFVALNTYSGLQNSHCFQFSRLWTYVQLAA